MIVSVFDVIIVCDIPVVFSVKSCIISIALF